MKTNFFLNCLRKEASSSFKETENGAIGHEKSKSPLVDMFFKMTSYRNKSEDEIYADFLTALAYDQVNAMKLLFFIGDIRKGLGERRTFCTILRKMADSHPELMKSVLSFIPEYSRWDYLESFFFTKLEEEALEIIKKTLLADLAKASWDEHKPITLLAKWLPSINTSSHETRAKAKKICAFLGWSEKEYRKTLSKLRKKLNVTEVMTSANEWSEIDYEKVPSKANLKYSSAFLRHDEERRHKYLEELSTGKKKINSSVVFPHEIVHKMNLNMYRGSSSYESMSKDEIRTLEEMWKSLPDAIGGREETVLTVVDGSGSMMSNLERTSVTSEDVAEAIGIYFSERISGPFKDKIITFSANPKYIDLSACSSLNEKLKYMKNFNECSNTNLYKVFELILNTAKKNSLRQDQLPSKVLVISDMEFDYCSDMGHDQTLFDVISRRYKEAGYSLPGLVFWNTCSRTCVVPVQENENGVALLSGFSTSVMDMVLSLKMDPEEILMDKLSSDRYDPIEEAVKGIVNE